MKECLIDFSFDEREAEKLRSARHIKEDILDKEMEKLLREIEEGIENAI